MLLFYYVGYMVPGYLYIWSESTTPSSMKALLFCFQEGKEEPFMV